MPIKLRTALSLLCLLALLAACGNSEPVPQPPLIVTVKVTINDEVTWCQDPPEKPNKPVLTQKDISAGIEKLRAAYDDCVFRMSQVREFNAKARAEAKSPISLPSASPKGKQ